ncbi:probable inactive receptor kinase At4g23740 [Olea europaea var. sylvestris]|uniref:probable inactive receptor kinase At4g23740 n=1 Tax=Olea europaea var. sylvestris TaxID=158386 RepID=UPI000C1D5EF8|nr:probable inactive receptor kinase At4g23740 [Olea europaea var. sylvestris]
MKMPQIFTRFFLDGFLLLLLQIHGSAAATLLENDKRALLDFAEKLPHMRTLNWNEQFPVCKKWTGVGCSEDGSRVISLRLPGVGFHGPIPQNTLSRLSALQILSLRSNRINGSFPLDFGNLKNLSYLYLQYNNFKGPLPLDFSVWKNLTAANLSNNGFNSSIPYSIMHLNQLTSLDLANNSLSGEIPDFHLPNLQFLNLSYNNLNGTVPISLQRFPKSVFLGNNDSLMEYTVSSSPVVLAPRDENPKSKSTQKLSEKALLGIVISIIGILAFGILLFICCLKRKKEDGFPGKLEKGGMSPEKAISRSQDANNRLVFFEGCNYAFDLEDLLRASAEVLGKGTFGMAYKAILEDATTVVVKRLKDVSVAKKEFEQQMEVIGNIKHENVIELKAYYYSKDEKLMVYDYYSRGSVASMLHGKGGEHRTLDWETRLKIATGAARGIARIHAANGGKLVHGNVKSANIFLNPRQYGCVSDLGLSTITSALSPPIARAAGYRAPELTDTRKATQPSDIYSFGVLLLELLTGKSPVHTTNGDEIVHLVRWVHSVVREEWTAEVFDVELLRYPNIEEELVEMLQIAMACVVRMPDQRPKILEVLKMIENVRHRDSENRPSSDNSTPVPPSPGV